MRLILPGTSSNFLCIQSIFIFIFRRLHLELNFMHFGKFSFPEIVLLLLGFVLFCQNRGMNYLHEHKPDPIIHRALKPRLALCFSV